MCTKNKSYSTTICVILSILFVTFVNNQVDADHHNDITTFSDIIDSWAQEFGLELKSLAASLTKTNELKEAYEQNLQIENGDNNAVITEIAEGISRLFKQRINAVKCIAEKAESAAENAVYNESEKIDVAYYSSKYSPINGTRLTDEKNETLCAVKDNNHLYKNMVLEPNSDFFNIAVNTEHSSVHVPNTDQVTDESYAVRRAINWTEALDEIFQDNYRADPSLDWQYFGSNTGVFRHYPARAWDTRGKVDHYDCRKQPWYIGTATGPKEVIILFDNSDEMSSFGQEHAEQVLNSILDTFSSYDKLNVFLYSDGIRPLVGCFNDVLVPGSPQYIEAFRLASKNVKFDGEGDIIKAYSHSFELLKKYRELRNSGETGGDSSQAIILITSEIEDDLKEVFDKSNKVQDKNDTNIPVRLFTYLLDDNDLSDINVRKIAACENRGYFSHIQREEDIQLEVFKYLDTFARPLVLNGAEHPVGWTTIYHEDLDNKNSTRSWISVSVPVFDKKPENYTAENTNLLGVVGTDILIEDINKLLLPYLLGVNGYAFIVDINGYVVTHPDLRFKENGILKKHLHVVDITELESLAENANIPVDQIREHLISRKVSKLLNVSSRYEYANNKRAVYKNYDYHFTPIPDTPFSLAIAVPSQYGSSVSKINITESVNEVNALEYFAEKNWSVQPEWIYCKYRILEGREFHTPEDELRAFLNKLEDPSWEWSKQYEEDENADKNSCVRKDHEADSYYCDEKLLKLLIFDAKITNETYSESVGNESEDNRLFEIYKASIHFTSTSSGLTRWRRISKNKSASELFLARGIDEAWYKSAVIQHDIDPDSFFYSISLDNDDNIVDDAPDDNNDEVIVSQALFLSKEENKVPIAVSGFQLSLNALKERFTSITSKTEVANETDISGTALNCNHTLIDCYLIDNNGYVVISEIENSTGKFFGQMEGEIMLSLVEKNIYKEIALNDFNALCLDGKVEENDAMTLITPFRIAKLTAEWLIAQLFLYLSNINIWVQSVPFENVIHKRSTTYEACKETDAMDEQEGDEESDNENQHHTNRACHKLTTLYILQQNLFLDNKIKADELRQRPFWLKRIPHSNLLLIVISNQFAEKLSIQTPTTTEVHYLQDYPCYKKLQNTTGKYERSFTSSPFETSASFCRSYGTILKIQNITTVLSMLLFTLFFLNFS